MSSFKKKLEWFFFNTFTGIAIMSVTAVFGVLATLMLVLETISKQLL